MRSLPASGSLKSCVQMWSPRAIGGSTSRAVVGAEVPECAGHERIPEHRRNAGRRHFLVQDALLEGVAPLAAESVGDIAPS